MKTNFSLRNAIYKILAGGAVLALFGSAGYVFGQEGVSHVRIVRLSFTQGTVSVERPGSSQWEAAPVNTPIQQGFKLATDSGGYAEVEFENSSTARLGEQSELDFKELVSVALSGAKINRMDLVSGYATLTVTPQNGDDYEVTAGRATLTPSGDSTFRVDLDQSAERVEVFKGHVRVSSPYGPAELVKDDVLEIQPGVQQAFVVTHGITTDAWDQWVASREQVLTAQYNSPGSQSRNPYPQYSSVWGWNELAYYGNWNYVPGIGYGWAPNLACGWDPFTVGLWNWYPGYGWTWISAEPWGWLPFHYGYWNYISGAGCGWYWFPGEFNSWSPGLVTWYQGNGWVGWSPQIPPGPPGRSHGPACGHGRPCVVAVSSSTFGHGGMIRPGNLINVQPSQGRVISTPSIAPLSGSKVAGGRIRVGPGPVGAGQSGIQTAGGSGLVAVGPRRAHFGGTAPSVVMPAAANASLKTPVKAGGGVPAAPLSGIVFDSRTGRFVNNANPEPSAGSGSAPAMQSSGHHFDFFGLFDHHNSPASGANSGSQQGTPPRASSAPAGGVFRGGESSAPRQAPAMAAPRGEPSFHSAPASSQNAGGGSFGGGGGGFHSSGGGGGGGGGGHASGGGGARTPH